MNRTTMSLIAGVAALAAVTGVASLAAPDDAAGTPARAAAQRPVERSSVLCPHPSDSEIADTAYTSYTPATKGSGTGGAAELRKADPTGTAGTAEDTAGAAKDKKKPPSKKGKDGKDGKDGKTGKGGGDAGSGKPFLAAKEPGKPVTGKASGEDSPALLGSADGGLAPGWTVQQTTEVGAGIGRGLLGLTCSAPDTDFWFAGASTDAARSDYVHLTNPDDLAAVVDIELYGKSGAVKSTVAEGIQVGPHQSVPVLLSTLTGQPQTNLAVHVSVRSGRVAAAIQADDRALGGDWLAAAAEPAGSLVFPGVPKDATAVRLVAFAPGEDDADLTVRLATPTGSITPAGHETLHVKSGMTAAVDLGDVTKGEPGSLVLTPSGTSAPVVAALRVLRGKGAKQESAFIPATAALTTRATVADNEGKSSTLSLVAPGATARVRVTTSAGSGGGAAASRTYEVGAGTTRAVDVPAPSGLKGTFAITVEHLSGGRVHASRTLARTRGGIPMFTIQTMPDDRGLVAVPEAGEDLTVLQK